MRSNGFFIAPSNLSYRLLGITKWKILWEIWGFRSESNVMNFTAHSFTHLIVLVCFFFCFILRKNCLLFTLRLIYFWNTKLWLFDIHIYIVPKMVHSFLKSLLHRIFLFGSLFRFGKTSMFFFVIALFSVHIFFIPILCQISSCQYFMRKKIWCEMRYPCEVCLLLLLLKQICRFWSIMSWVFKGNVMNE